MTELTPQLIGVIVCDLQKGHFVSTVCEAHGVSKRSFYRWLKKGEQGDPAYFDFYEQVTRAQAAAEMELFEEVKKGDSREWGFGPSRAALELLKVTRPKKYAQRIHVKVEQELEGLLDVCASVLSGKVCSCYEEILAALAARASGEETSDDSGDEAPIEH